MLVSGYNNIILLPNCTMLYYVFSGPLSLRAYVPEIKFNNNKINRRKKNSPNVLGGMATMPPPPGYVTVKVPSRDRSEFVFSISHFPSQTTIQVYNMS